MIGSGLVAGWNMNNAHVVDGCSPSTRRWPGTLDQSPSPSAAPPRHGLDWCAGPGEDDLDAILAAAARKSSSNETIWSRRNRKNLYHRSWKTFAERDLLGLREKLRSRAGGVHSSEVVTLE